MLLTVADDENEFKVLVVGLEEEDIELLKNDEPITAKLMGNLAKWEIVIFGPEDTFKYKMQRDSLNLV